MKNLGYLAMKNDELIDSDLRELGLIAKRLANHTFLLGSSLGFGINFLKFLASVAAIYLLILDRTNWRTNMLTALLVPYIFFSLPSIIFSFLRGEVGKWIAFIAVVLRLFFPRHFPGWLEIPGSLILLLVAAPGFIAFTIRDGILGVIACLLIGCFLLQEHIRASGGLKNSFTKSKGVSNTVGILLLFLYPVWYLVLSFV
ncbi:hypothetical protein HPP92_018820 [Vanilla planifolia]|uniref:Uncharacterized protein n=1 Tax=Vanilla planifolia TaxID=51239 RepID=A0A835Q6F3_VANPL|nr:hypothetical protein HPP92_018820 [Vanilla planifolia]